MAHPKVLAFVLAGGKGERLFPLTAFRSKPSVPFGGKYRIVDFVLSNLANSGVSTIYLLAQYKPESLIGHIEGAWGSWLATRGVSMGAELPARPGRMPIAPDQPDANKAISNAKDSHLYWHQFQRSTPGKAMIVCVCRRVSDREIARHARVQSNARLGVAQVQIVFEGKTTRNDRESAAEDLLRTLEPVMQAIGKGVSK